MPSYKLCRCGGVIDERAKPLTCTRCGINERIKPQRSNKTGAERGYDSDWDKLSKRFRANNPWCSECLRNGRYTLARDVHHVVPIERDPSRRLDVTNLVAVCRSCHWDLETKARRQYAN